MFLEPSQPYLKGVKQMRRHEEGSYAPGTRVEVIDDQAPKTPRAGVVLHVGSDAKVLVSWDDESMSVLPQEALLTLADDAPS
jgi:hypothetical protein